MRKPFQLRVPGNLSREWDYDHNSYKYFIPEYRWAGTELVESHNSKQEKPNDSCAACVSYRRDGTSNSFVQPT